MTKWQNYKITKGRTDKKRQDKQNCRSMIISLIGTENEMGLKKSLSTKKLAGQSKNWYWTSQRFLWDILMWIDFQGGGEKNLG